MHSSPIAGLIGLYELILFVRIVLTWIPHDREHPAAGLLFKVTEPALEPIRKVIPPVAGIDASPIALFIGLEFVKRIFS
ncbi:MAG: YggT family protein [Candidatus Brocadiales bacterium]|nr:YggT family protein [Candidatus Bathyanammoxibius sp.]MCQ4574600.1 YggT family protein [Candidatus Bathyanammoxibius amoris]